MGRARALEACTMRLTSPPRMTAVARVKRKIESKACPDQICLLPDQKPIVAGIVSLFIKTNVDPAIKIIL